MWKSQWKPDHYFVWHFYSDVLQFLFGCRVAEHQIIYGTENNTPGTRVGPGPPEYP